MKLNPNLINDDWLKRRGVHTLKDAERIQNAELRKRGKAAQELTQMPDHLRGGVSPLMGLAEGDCRGFWRGPLWDPKTEGK